MCEVLVSYGDACVTKSKTEAQQKGPTIIQRQRMIVGSFCISVDSANVIHFAALAPETEGIQWEQAVPVAHDLACKV